MSGRGPLLGAALALVQRDARLFFSYRLRLVAQGFAILFSVSLFYYVSRLVRVEAFPTPDTYFAYVVVGLATVEILTASLAAVPAAVRQELVSGTFERLVVVPLGPVGAIVAMAGFPILLSWLVGGATIAMGVAVFGLPLHWSTAPLALVVAALASAAFLPFTLLVSCAVLLFKQAGAAAAFVTTALGLASGAFFPPTLLPGWIAWISDVQPLRPALELMRYALLGVPVDVGVVGALARLVGFAAVGIPLCALALSAVVARCRRRGTLTEY